MPSLEFTLMVGCPLKCTLCPQDTLRAAYGDATKYFSLSNFWKIIEKLPPHVRIDFSGMAEPWANPEATNMLEAALRLGRNVAIYTTLYGMEDGDHVADLLTDFASQIEVLCLHLPDANGNMRGWKYSPEYETTLRRFLALRGVVPLEVMTMDGCGKVHPDLGHMGIFLTGWTGHTRAGNVDPSLPRGTAVQEKPHHTAPVICSFTPFYDQNVVLPNGDVVLCCMDYSAKHRLGNLLDQEYYDIFAGEELGLIRAENMKHDFAETSLCRTCNRAVPLKTEPSRRLMWVAA